MSQREWYFGRERLWRKMDGRVGIRGAGSMGGLFFGAKKAVLGGFGGTLLSILVLVQPVEPPGYDKHQEVITK